MPAHHGGGSSSRGGGQQRQRHFTQPINPSSSPAKPARGSRLAYLFLPVGLAIFCMVLQWREGSIHSLHDWSHAREYHRQGALSGAGCNGSAAAAAGGAAAVGYQGPGNSKSSDAFGLGADWVLTPASPTPTKVCIVTTTAEGDPQRVRPWMDYHRSIGVDRFYLFVEGKASQPEVVAEFGAMPGVEVVDAIHDPAVSARQKSSRIWKEKWLSWFFNKPCNFDLFVRQNLNLEEAIARSRREGVHWMLHVDTDELIYPGGAPDFSLKRLLDGVAPDVDTLVLPNYEAAVERDDVGDPFTEVTLFKRNYNHVKSETYFQLYKEATGANPNYFLTYGNGKAAARIQPGVRPHGAHRFHNYNKKPLKEVRTPEAAVLHYTYTRFSDIKARSGRCSCKPTPQDAERCFILKFDRESFLKASTVKDEGELRRWYVDRVVWNNADLKERMLAGGLLLRLYTPQIIMRGLNRRIAAGGGNGTAGGVGAAAVDWPGGAAGAGAAGGLLRGAGAWSGGGGGGPGGGTPPGRGIGGETGGGGIGGGGIGGGAMGAGAGASWHPRTMAPRLSGRVAGAGGQHGWRPGGAGGSSFALGAGKRRST